MFSNFTHAQSAWNASYQTCCTVGMWPLNAICKPTYLWGCKVFAKEFSLGLLGFFYIISFIPEIYVYTCIADVTQNTFEQPFNREMMYWLFMSSIPVWQWKAQNHNQSLIYTNSFRLFGTKLTQWILSGEHCDAQNFTWGFQRKHSKYFAYKEELWQSVWLRHLHSTNCYLPLTHITNYWLPASSGHNYTSCMKRWCFWGASTDLLG